jgi:hypothetical protein
MNATHEMIRDGVIVLAALGAGFVLSGIGPTPSTRCWENVPNTACGIVSAGLTCPPDVEEDGDCPSVKGGDAGFSSSTHFKTKCVYRRMLKDPEGNCTIYLDIASKTYEASCTTGTGSPCP